MKIIWVLESEVWTKDEEERIEQAIQSEGSEIYHYQLGQDLNQLRALRYSSEDKPVVGRGSIGFIKRIDCGFPWSFVNWFCFRCSNYYSYLSDFLLSQDFVFMPWRLLPVKKDFLYSVFGKDGNIFIRPDSNDKVFSGRLVSRDDFDTWHGNESLCYDPPQELQCVVAKPEEITNERRFICSVQDCDILSSSLYKDQNLDQTICLSESQKEQVQKILIKLKENECILDNVPFIVLDMAETPTGHKLIEIGSVNCCSWYNCDPVPVVRSIEKHIRETW